jgi:hypothetical protein
MARTTLEMFIKLIGADKVGRALDSTSKKIKNTQDQVDKGTKENAKYAAGMSGLSKAAVAGAAAIAGKSLLDFSLSAIQAASSAQEAAGAFGTTFGGAAEQLNNQLKENANLFGLTSAEAQQLISVFGSVAQGIGFTQSESADLSSELFNLAGDIASFNNITAGAAPVLQAFRSALVGEREALKTYGIAITEAEVQTKAFEQTGKTSAEALTRQEKALATTALIFERSSVQQGNAAREAAGFAAQTLIARSATQELREELGEELLPAAGEVLRVFNEMRVEATPELIDRFADLNTQVLGAVGLFNDLRLALDGSNDEQSKVGEFLDKDINRFNVIGKVLAAYGIKQKAQILFDKKQTESTEELVQQFDNYAKNTSIINNSLNKNKSLVNLLIPTQKKFGTTLKKDVLPFAEKLAGVLGISAQQIKDLTDLQENRDDAQKDLNRALEEEGLITAQEALRKKELQQQIAELTFFQGQGKNVTEELAVAQEELRLIELALQRESDQLVEARKRATEAQEDLDEATGKGTSAMETQLEAAQNLQNVLDLFATDNFQESILEAADILNITWAEAINGALENYRKLLEKVEGKSLVEIVDKQLAGLNLVGGFQPSPLVGGVETPAGTLGDQSSVSQNNGNGTEQTFIIPVYIGDDKVDEVIQKSTNRQSTQGKTLSIR